MWCPNCKSEYREGFTICPTCKVPLVEMLEEAEVSDAGEETGPVLLMSFQDREELGLATGLLEQAEIPYLLKEPGSGELLRLATGQSWTGTEVYVSPQDLRPALLLLRCLNGGEEEAAPFDEAELDRAINEFEAAYPEEAKNEEEGGPASPEGYRIALIFLVVFGVGALVALLYPWLSGLLSG